MVQIAPSILSADFARLGEHLAQVEAGGADIVHFDVMDGHFVPNISIGLPVVSAVKKVTKLPIDTHLMITEPARYVEQFIAAGASMVSVHVEADPHLNRTLAAIRKKGAQAGIVLNPATPVSSLEEALPFADYVLIMSVNPGFGGQKFIEASADKVRRLRRMIDARGLNVRIEIDGGIDTSNAAQVVAAGAEILVAGSAIFAQPDPAQAVRDLRASATPVI
jgi:ribulose-phosphate 3-epimerase